MLILRDKELSKRQLFATYEKIFTSVTGFILSRWQRDIDYGWIDTKINLITGCDYPQSDILKGKDTVYGWIQGRGIEAMTRHAIWLENNSTEVDIDKLKTVIRTVLLNLNKAREINAGHLHFFMDTDGKALEVNTKFERNYLCSTDTKFHNYTDLFCSKGMLAAAKYLGITELRQDAAKYCIEVEKSIWQGDFVSDQFSFRGKISSSGRVLNSTGPYMLMLSTACMLLDEDAEMATNMALKLMNRILSLHINTDDSWNFGERYDCVENIDPDGKPVVNNGVIETDPGHSLEFTGLALKFIYESRGYRLNNRLRKKLDLLVEPLISILFKSFENGYIESVQGICKSFDLVSRSVLDSDMPWWSLPETMRAAMYGASLAEDGFQRQQTLEVFHKCHNAFVENYLRPDIGYMSIQTRGSDGKVKATIPATPDADPGYHTGISLIDCYNLLKEM